MEVLEFDDLRVRVEKVRDQEVDERKELAREIFDLADSVNDEDFDWAARVSVGLDRLVEDFSLDSMAYYHRGLEGEIHERLGAGMILGASLLTARGIPMAGEYEVRTMLAMLIAIASGPAGRSPSSRRSTSATAWWRWAMTGPPTSPSARSSRSCAASVSTTARGAGV